MVKNSPVELTFINEILNTFNDNIDYKDRHTYEINATIAKIIHSDRNFYVGCAYLAGWLYFESAYSSSFTIIH